MKDHDDRHDDMGSAEEFELTPSEKRDLETLPRERIPNAVLEDRVVDALHARRLLSPRGGRVVEMNGRRIAAAVAACLVLLAAGFALGQWSGSRQENREGIIAHEVDDTSIAASLQKAGSAYVEALRRLAEMPDSINGDQAQQGREVALATLYTAAARINSLVPGELAAARPGAAESGKARAGDGETRARVVTETVIQF